MYRLIVQLKEPLNDTFCIDMMNLIGQYKLVPMTLDYYVLEGFNMDVSQSNFEELLALTKKYTNRAFLTDKIDDLDELLDSQIYWLRVAPEYAFISEIEPPEIFMYLIFRLNEEKWLISGSLCDDY